MKNVRFGVLLFSLILPVFVGVISAYLSADGMAAYGDMNKPPLSPPSWVFSVAWTILYLMMGLASYFVIVSQENENSRNTALILYGVQLAMNFMWSVIFFNWEMYFVAFVWLFIMLCVVVACMFEFLIIDRRAAYLMVPYVFWLIFAGYLNMGAYLLRKA